MIFDKNLRQAKKFAKKASKQNKKSAENYQKSAEFFLKYAKQSNRKLEYDIDFSQVFNELMTFFYEKNNKIISFLNSDKTINQKYNCIAQYYKDYNQIKIAQSIFIELDFVLEQDFENDSQKLEAEAQKAIKIFAFERNKVEDYDMFYEINKLVYNVTSSTHHAPQEFINVRKSYALALCIQNKQKGNDFLAVKQYAVAYYLGARDEKIFKEMKEIFILKTIKYYQSLLNLSYNNKQKFEFLVNMFYCYLDFVVFYKQEYKKEAEVKNDFKELIQLLISKNIYGKKTTVKKMMKNYVPLGSLLELEYIKEHAETVDLKIHLLTPQDKIWLNHNVKDVVKQYGELNVKLKEYAKIARKEYEKDPIKYDNLIPYVLPSSDKIYAYGKE